MPESHTHWEEHYSAKPRVWSGRVNTRLAEIVPRLTGIRALDVGCGEGADAIWLAEHGWEVVGGRRVHHGTGPRGRGREARGVSSRIDFQAARPGADVPRGVLRPGVGAVLPHSAGDGPVPRWLSACRDVGGPGRHAVDRRPRRGAAVGQVRRPRPPRIPHRPGRAGRAGRSTTAQWATGTRRVCGTRGRGVPTANTPPWSTT